MVIFVAHDARVEIIKFIDLFIAVKVQCFDFDM